MQNMLVQPYLFFGGHCEEALNFYHAALDAQVEMLVRFNESPEPMPSNMLQAGFENKVMHAAFRVGSVTILASDGCNDNSSFSGFSLVLTVSTEQQADRFFAALGEGGQVKMPLAKTFWSPWYGMLTDRFGIDWMIMVPERNT